LRRWKAKVVKCLYLLANSDEALRRCRP
jgi:hypothetical protein